MLLINITIDVYKLGHHINLNNEARVDLEAWCCFLSSYNGIYTFIDSKWVSSDLVILYTDTTSTQGFAAVFEYRWFNGRFLPIWQSYGIVVLELYPIVAAIMGRLFV